MVDIVVMAGVAAGEERVREGVGDNVLRIQFQSKPQIIYGANGGNEW